MLDKLEIATDGGREYRVNRECDASDDGSSPEDLMPEDRRRPLGRTPPATSRVATPRSHAAAAAAERPQPPPAATTTTTGGPSSKSAGEPPERGRAKREPTPRELRELMARRLRAARRAYNERAAVVARQLGVTPQLLNQYERAITYPSEALLVRFSLLTGCPTDWIFLGRITQEMPPVMAARIGAMDPELLDLGPEASEKAAAGIPVLQSQARDVPTGQDDS